MKTNKSHLLLLAVLTLPAIECEALNTGLKAEDIYHALKKHPELLDEALARAKKPHREMSRHKKQNDRARQHHELVYEEKGYPLIGNEKAAHTVVVFADPQCAQCHTLLSDLVAYVGQNDDVKFVLKNIPYLGEGSQKLSEQALAAMVNGTFSLWLNSYLNHPGRIDAAAIESLSKIAQEGPQELVHFIEQSKKIARQLNINSTPTFVVADKVYEDYRGLESFSALLDRRLRKAITSASQ